mmetsp:Transcript_40846/g.80469  ORF Transcript_40846/g.80469 Transcript_40846/m.80469 type:complete len:335 (+) Transcript_40846:300-1304(+)
MPAPTAFKTSNCFVFPSFSERVHARYDTSLTPFRGFGTAIESFSLFSQKGFKRKGLLSPPSKVASPLPIPSNYQKDRRNESCENAPHLSKQKAATYILEGPAKKRAQTAEFKISCRRRLLGDVGELGGASDVVLEGHSEEANHGNAAVVELLVAEVKVLLGILGLAVGDAGGNLIGVGLLVEHLVHKGNKESNLSPAGSGEGGEGSEATGDIREGGAVLLEGKVEAGVEVSGETGTELGGSKAEDSEHSESSVLELLESVLLELLVLRREVKGVEDGEPGETVLAGAGSVLEGHLHLGPGGTSDGLDTSESEGIDRDCCESADGGSDALHFDAK